MCVCVCVCVTNVVVLYWCYAFDELNFMENSFLIQSMRVKIFIGIQKIILVFDTNII